MEKNRHGYLINFPYHEEQGQFLIQKKMQSKRLISEFFNPKLYCKEATRNEIIWRVMFWLGIIFAMIAITVSLLKELDEGRKSEDVILHLSIVELILAVISIVITLSKHGLRHNTLILLQKNIKVDGRESIEKKLSNRRKVYFALGAVLILFVSALLVSFLVMHFKDDETYQYLTYTKFTTTLTLFLSIILDGIINDVLTDAYSEAKIDQCKLTIHQLNLELNAHLVRVGSGSRADDLQRFLNSHEVFSLVGNEHISYKDKTNREEMDDQNLEEERRPLTAAESKNEYGDDVEML